MTEKPQTDWEAIEREYRAGQLSVREIGRIYGVTEGAIRKKAKLELWARDLTKQVREAVRTKLVRSEVRSEDTRTIVDDASNRGVALVLRHRAGLQRQNDHLIQLQEKLEALIPDLSDLKELDTAQGIVESMARTRARLIPLERQAFALDEGKEPTSPSGDNENADSTYARIVARARVGAHDGSGGQDVAVGPGPSAESGGTR